MAKEKYEPPKIEILNKKDEPVDITPSHGNTRLPFGLCMRYGIAIGKDWTPRDAWDALKGKGITPDEVYSDVKKDGKVNEVKAEPEQPKVEEKKQEQQKTEEIDVKKVESEFEGSDVFRYGAKIKDYAVKAFNVGSAESKSILLGAVKTGEVRYEKDSKDHCTLETGTVYLSGKKSGVDSAYYEGQQFWHESFHSIDGNYGEKSFYSGFSAASDYLDVGEGKSLDDVLREEFETIKDKADDLKAEVKQFQKEEEKRFGFDMDKYRSASSEYGRQKTQIDNVAKDTIDAIAEAYLTRKITLSEYYAKKEEANNVKKEQLKALNKTDFAKEQKKQLKLYNRAKNSAIHKYMTLSDLFSSESIYLTGFGHKPGYWLARRSRLSSEFFANTGAAYTANAEEYELLKKYLPKSVKAFETIVNKIKNGEIKTWKERSR